ncbi:MAG TPA: hypothetical protein DEH22_16415 [Chloroflexi bacterium]|nr:hypothetical protein [Chloroflexota bacterium]
MLQLNPSARFQVLSTVTEIFNQFTPKYNRTFNRHGWAYDWIVKVLPIWQRWVCSVIPYIVGPNVLEISCENGYLISSYANQYKTYGITSNWEAVCKSRKNLREFGAHAQIQHADSAVLPFAKDTFSTVINTMAFSCRPNQEQTMAEVRRVLKPHGRFLLVEMGYPGIHKKLGMQVYQLWGVGDDIVGNTQVLFKQFGFDYHHQIVGGFGSVHLFVGIKKSG